jgi:uncharacterized protein
MSFNDPPAASDRACEEVCGRPGPLDKGRAHALSWRPFVPSREALVRNRSPLVVLSLLLATLASADSDHAAEIEAWRARRAANLTSETGWLTLVALHPLRPGKTTFGSAPSNAFPLAHPGLAAHAGTFVVRKQGIRFVAKPAGGVTHEGNPVKSIDLKTDADGSPTLLGAGSLRFFVIDREGKFYVRVRDVEHPARRGFAGLRYFPVSPDWVVEARFEPYAPPRKIPIVDILGEERPMSAPGALVFVKDGREWRLDAIEESPDEKELFIMFADQTSGRETYGAGRFMYVARPRNGRVTVDFNKAYNPPCAFNDFATCPLPPQQNRIELRIPAGELSYGREKGEEKGEEKG